LFYGKMVSKALKKKAVSPVICSGLTNTDNVNGVETSSLRLRLNLNLRMKEV